MNFQTHIVADGSVSILELAGRFDAYEEARVKEQLDKCITSSQAKVVVNLNDVHFIDSSALAVLVQGLKRCRKQDGDLYICGLQTPVQIIFQLTRLDRAFHLFANKQEAVAAFL